MDGSSQINQARVDYYQRLSEAVAALVENTPQARLALYGQWRDVLRQKALADEITSYGKAVESVALEAAIDRIEKQLAPSQTVQSDDDIAKPLIELQRLASLHPTSSADRAAPERFKWFRPAVALDRFLNAIDPSVWAGRLRSTIPTAQRSRQKATDATELAILVRFAAAFVVVVGITTFGLTVARDLKWPLISAPPERADLGPTTTTSTPQPVLSPVEQQAAARDETADDVCGPDLARGCKTDKVTLTVEPAEVPKPPRLDVKSKVPAARAAFEAGSEATKAAANSTQALSAFNQAIKLDPTFPEAFVSRGQLYFRRGNLARALADFNKAIRLDPQHALALKSRAMAHLSNGDAELAMADFNRAISLATADPGSLPALDLFHARRARATLYDVNRLYDSEQKDLTAIIDAYQIDSELQAALKTRGAGDSAIAAIYQKRAAVHAQRNQPLLAIADLSAAIELGGIRTPTALIERAKLYESLGMTDKAAGDRKRAVRSDLRND